MNYVRLSFVGHVKGKVSHVWAIEISSRIFEEVTFEGERKEPRHLIVLHPLDIVKKREAKMNLHYGELEIA